MNSGACRKKQHRWNFRTTRRDPGLRKNHNLRLILIGLTLTLGYVTILVPLGFLENARAASADTLMRWRNAVSRPPSQVQDFLLVRVDDASQRYFNQKWPWDRTAFAEFLQKMTPHRPALVLFDFAFMGEGPAESDAAFARAIREGPPTLIATYVDPSGNLMLPQDSFIQAGALTGFINKPLDPDHAIRRMWSAIRFPGSPEPLYAMEVQAAAILRGIPADQIRREPSFLINYLVAPEQIPAVSLSQFFEGTVAPSSIRNKIILVGSTREITHDIHPTPLGRISGIVVEANGLLTLITQRHLATFPLWVKLTFSFLLVWGILQMTFRMLVAKSLAATVLLVCLSVLGGCALTFRDITAESVSPLVLAGSAWCAGFFYKHVILFADTLRLQRQAVTDFLTGTLTARYFRLRLDQELATDSRAGKPLALLLIQIVSPSQLLQNHSWEETLKRVRTAVDSLRGALPPGSLMGRIEENRMGLLMPLSSIQAQKLTQKLIEILQPTDIATALALTWGSSGSWQTGPHMIAAAESALARTQAQEGLFLEIADPAKEPHPGRDDPASKTKLHEMPTPLEHVSSELEERNRALEKALAQLRQVHQQLESAFLEVTKSLVLALETKDAYTAGHLERVSRYSTRLAQALSLPKQEVEAIREAALLHDIGKIGLPDEVLHKIGKLTDEERDIMRQHLAIGAKILEPMKFFKSITTLIYHHHEWYNGQGYPHGLAGDLIPSGAQVIAIADAFDAMTTSRSYHKPVTPQEALAELQKGSGTQFNPRYVEKFLELICREGP